MYITGAAWITPAGSGRGHSSEPFGLSAGVLPDIRGIDFPQNPVFRKGRLDRFSLLGLQAITDALYDAGLYEPAENRETGLVASTVYGCLQTDLDFYDTATAENGNLPEPNLFTHTLSNIFLGYASILFNIKGPNYVYYEKNNNGLAPLMSAMESIEQGECGIMAAGICDIEAPKLAPDASSFEPGAVFVVIEKSPDSGKRNFGKLSMDCRGRILLNKTVINDIAMCIGECLKNRV